MAAPFLFSSSSRRRDHGCSFVLSVLVVAAFLVAFGFGAALGAAGSSDRVLLNVESLFPGPSCLMPQEHKHGGATGTRMKIVHQHGPCSPLADAHAKPPSHEEILAADQSRVGSIQRRVSETTSRGKLNSAAWVRPGPSYAETPWPPGPSYPETPWPRPSYPETPWPRPSTPPPASLSSSASLPAYSGEALGTSNYVVTIGLGTPEARFTVVFDTGGDTTWVQCQPCAVVCYGQKEPLFNPAKSSTYANISCASSYCSDLYHNKDCSRGHCLYGVQYGDGSSTVGFYAQDTLTLSSYDTFEGFRFGCGQNNHWLLGQTAGLLGLGRGKTSLTMQAYGKYGGVFAYCLPATSAGTGCLDFGPVSPAANTRLTPMLTDKGPTFYYVGMTGIRVGGQQLAIPGSVFSTAGTLVDSGTVITRLPPTAYSALRSAFARAMSSYGYKTAPAFWLLDTCYDFTGLGKVTLPAVSLVFQGGASLDVDASGIMYWASVSQVCLGFAPNHDDGQVGIIGNMQQKTYRVLYDLGKKVVGFVPRAC